MYKKLVLLVALLPGISVSGMEQTKEMLSMKESSQRDVVIIQLTDSQNSDTVHAVAIPYRLAKLIGAISDLLEDSELREAGLPLLNVSLAQWRFIESQLEKLYSIVHDDPNGTHSREAIIEEYELLDAQGLIEVIHALDYADIPLLLELACEMIKKRTLGRFSFQQINSLPGDMGNRVLLHNILSLGGPMPARELAVFRGHKLMVTSICIFSDGKVVSGSYDGTMCAYYMKEESDLEVCKDGHKHMVVSICVTRDGKIVSGSYDGTLCVWDMSRNDFIIWSGHGDLVFSVCVSSDGKIVSGSKDKIIRVWDMKGNQLAECRGHAEQVNSVYVTNDGKIVSGSSDRTVRVWDMQGKELAIGWGHEDLVSSVCVTSDGKIVSGSLDGTVRVWDMQGQEIALCRGHKRGLLASPCVTRDEKVVSGSQDNTVRVWDMRGKELAVCGGHENTVSSVCVMNDGKIVSGSRDKTIRVWDMRGEELAICRGHEGCVTSICVIEWQVKLFRL